VESNSRYDVELFWSGGSLVIENKTKSVGSADQVARYEAADRVVVPLGLTTSSFAEDGHPTYQVILSSLDDIMPRLPGNDFSTLIRHYRAFLERELDVYELMHKAFESEGGASRIDLIERLRSLMRLGIWRENDLRFGNLHYLELFRRRHLRVGALQAEWRASKNMSSGTWVANYPNKGSLRGFEHGGLLESLVADHKATFWIHLELHSGIAADGPGKKAGTLQLRAAADGSNCSLRDSFIQSYKLRAGERLLKRPAEKHNTFGLVNRALLFSDLEFSRLNDLMHDFVQAWYVEA
jgi:hypothetical protein